MRLEKDEKSLHEYLQEIDKKIDLLNDQKILFFIDYLALGLSKDDAEDCLKWENILFVVPDRHISNQIKKYKYSISRIHFLTNPNAEKIHIFDFNDWRNSTRNKTQFQIREFLKTNFGGVKKQDHDSK
ncbi:hypothetical protein K6T82_11070 [Flavobacterium sp. 17A]|uniref:Uncharacterized protein n=1 Tax=Flavobacterium potami TaxID=2872310 RepID=A0A9X1H9N5_9FLAO|nr:hypothetical protein [Flavobacterium potami]MBZ4035309.1 hypothetical protein [Flavobacterium potami]